MKGPQKYEMYHVCYKSIIKARKCATYTTAADGGKSLSSHARCASVKCAFCIWKYGLSATQVASGLQTQVSWLQGSSSFYHAGLKEWRGQGKNGVGGISKKQGEQRKLWRRCGKRHQHQLQELLPQVCAQCCQTPAERKETQASSLPKARA